MSGRWSPNSSSINTQLSPLSSIGGMTRCLMLFRHNVTFFGGELLVRGAEHEHRSLRSSFCSEWSRIWFVRAGWRCWRVTYTHFITLNAKTTETTPVIWCPWERKAQSPGHWLQVSTTWPLGVWPTHVDMKWTQAHLDASMNAATPHKTTFPWHIGYRHSVNHAAGLGVSLCF